MIHNPNRFNPLQMKWIDDVWMRMSVAIGPKPTGLDWILKHAYPKFIGHFPSPPSLRTSRSRTSCPAASPGPDILDPLPRRGNIARPIHPRPDPLTSLRTLLTPPTLLGGGGGTLLVGRGRDRDGMFEEAAIRTSYSSAAS